MECQYCKQIFRTHSSLNNHQKTAKYCLKLRGYINPKGKFTCLCEADFTSKYSLENHKLKCTQYSTEVVELRQQVIELQAKLSDALRREQELRADYAELAKISAKRPTTKNTVTNNLNLSVFNKSAQDIKKIVEENYTKEYLLEGQKGVAKFTCIHVINDDKSRPPIYVITDKARGNGKYKVSNDQVVADYGMIGLTKKVHPSIKQRAGAIATQEDALSDEQLFKGFKEVYEMNENNSIFRTELIRMLEQADLGS